MNVTYFAFKKETESQFPILKSFNETHTLNFLGISSESTDLMVSIWSVTCLSRSQALRSKNH